MDQDTDTLARTKGIIPSMSGLLQETNWSQEPFDLHIFPLLKNTPRINNMTIRMLLH